MDYVWKVTERGDMICERASYVIPAERLGEDGWVSHMFEKSWVDRVQFLRAFKVACWKAGVKDVRIGYVGEKIPITKLVV